MVQVTPSQSYHNAYVDALASDSTTTYQDLLDSFLAGEAQEPAPSSEPVTVQKELTQAQSLPKTEQDVTTSLFSQRTKEQLTAIEQRLICVQNSASRGSTNAHSIEKDLIENLPSNIELQTLFRENLQAAYRMRGENLGLVNSYKQSLSKLNPYISMMENLKVELEKNIDLLLKIESTADLIFADIDAAIVTFQDSLATTEVINDFSKPLDEIYELIDQIKSTQTNLDEFCDQMADLHKKMENRRFAIIFYQNGPQDPHLIKKDPQEFDDELNQIEANLALLKRHQSLIPTFEKTKVSISTQLKNLESFTKELHKLQKSHFTSMYRNQSEAELENVTYNGRSAVGFFNLSHAAKV